MPLSVALIVALIAAIAMVLRVSGNLAWLALLPVAAIVWLVASAGLTLVTTPRSIFEYKKLPYEIVKLPPGYAILPGDITHTAEQDAQINYYAIGLSGSKDDVARLRRLSTVARIDLAGAAEEGGGRARFTVRRKVEIDLQPGMQVTPGLDELNVTLTHKES